MKEQKRFNHGVTIAFSVDTDHDREQLTREEIREALLAQLDEALWNAEIFDTVDRAIEDAGL